MIRRTVFLVVTAVALMAVPGAAQPAFEVHEASVPELQAALAAGRVTSVGLVDAYLARIAAYDRAGPELRAILRTNPAARAEAARLDEERRAGRLRGPLHGIPIILKDNYDTRDMPTTDGSIALAGVVPAGDAFQVARLREAGAIILAKANMHEYARGITTVGSLGGQTLNPYDPDRYPGGSSGGSAAAAAASYAAIAWGSDTCGSIRIPAAFNNLFGLRPTKGLSSIAGIIPLSHTQDVGGPLARSVIDLAIGLDATVGPDPADPATRILAGRAVPRFVAALDSAALRGRRLGVLSAYFGDGPEERSAVRVVRAAIDSMRASGAEVIDIEIPGLAALVDSAGVINHEFRFDLEDYLAGLPDSPVRTHRELLERGLLHEALEQRLLITDTVRALDSPAYRKALARRDSARALVVRTLDAHAIDVLVYPTTNRPPARIGDPQGGTTCALSAVTGLPALSMPAGFTEDGLPLGVELLGRPLADTLLVAMASAYEAALRPRRPPERTPPLVDGRAPAPVAYRAAAGGGPAIARSSFSFDVTRGTLDYDVAVPGVADDDVFAIGLHRARDGGSIGPMLRNLAGPGTTAARGTLRLSMTERDGLRNGRMLLVVFTRSHPLGAVQGALRPAGR